MDRVLIKQRLQPSVVYAIGLQMGNFLLLDYSMEQFLWRIRLDLIFSAFTSANLQFGPLLFALKNLKPLIICLWQDLGIKNCLCILFKEEKLQNQLATEQLLVSQAESEPRDMQDLRTKAQGAYAKAVQEQLREKSPGEATSEAEKAVEEETARL